jgi:hypothetical protein
MNIGFWWDSQKETDYWEYLEVGGRIILKRILERQDGVMRNVFIAFKAGTIGEPKRWEILEQLRNWRLLKKVSAAWSETVHGVHVPLLACDVSFPDTTETPSLNVQAVKVNLCL